MIPGKKYLIGRVFLADPERFAPANVQAVEILLRKM
jgi:hypothetical protein